MSMFPVQSGRPSAPYNPDAPVQPIQIIVFALMMGVLVFAGIATFLKINNPNPPNPNAQQPDLLPQIAVGMAAIMVAMRFVVPAMMAKGQLKAVRHSTLWQDERRRQGALYGVYQQRTIVEDAMLEGVSFFLIVAFIVTGQWWLLGVVGLLVALMAAWFPTKGRIENFIQEQTQQLEFEGEQ
jgi:protein-S-isoprenylcysteine O-methyltransferase Ste14